MFALDNCGTCRSEFLEVYDTLKHNYETVDQCDTYLADLGDILGNHLRRTEESVDEFLRGAQARIIWSCLALVLTVTLCPLLVARYVKSADEVAATRRSYVKATSQKTNELKAEKNKADSLLYQLLPRTIAEDLKSDKSVLAESYQSVTIYFSDIVGFTSIAAASTPFQVGSSSSSY